MFSVPGALLIGIWKVLLFSSSFKDLIWVVWGVSGNLLLLILVQLTLKKCYRSCFLLPSFLHMACDLERSCPISRGIFVSMRWIFFVMFTATPKLLICPLSRPLKIVLLSAFKPMYHAVTARIIHLYRSPVIFFCLCFQRLIIAVLRTLRHHFCPYCCSYSFRFSYFFSFSEFSSTFHKFFSEEN